MAPTLYLTQGSPPARSVLITATAIGLDLEKKEVDLSKDEHLTPEFLKLNPQHTVPTLVDGDYVLWDSHAINPYLVSKYAKDDSLYPKDLQKRGIIDNRLHFNNATFFHAARTIVLSIFRGATSISEENIKAIEESYELLNTLLKKSKFIAGDNVTIADFSIIATLSSIEFLVHVDGAKFPKLTEWVKRVQQLPCYEVNLPGLKMLKEFVLSKLSK